MTTRDRALTEAQAARIRAQLAKGADPRDVAAKHGITLKQARTLKAQPEYGPRVKKAAEQLVAAESALRSLSPVDQLQALDLAEELRAISHNLARAASAGSLTSRRLAEVAEEESRSVKKGGHDNMRTLAQVAALTEVSKASASIGLNLLNANKGATGQDTDDKDRRTLADFYRAVPKPRAA